MNYFDNILKVKYQKDITISGLTDEFFSVYINNLYKQNNNSILIVTNSLYEANKIYNSLNNYILDINLFPMDDFLTSEAIAISPDLQISRIETIKNIINNRKAIVITNLMGYLRFLPNKDKFSKSIITLQKNKEYNLEELKEKILNLGYKKETIVTSTGEVAFRNYIIDIFPTNYDNPIRIEFFGDEIDSIRYFDPTTQISKKPLESLEITPFWEYLIDDKEYIYEEIKQKNLPFHSKNVVNILDYLDNPITIFKDYNQLCNASLALEEEMFNYNINSDEQFQGRYMFDFSTIKSLKNIYYMSINNINKDLKVENKNYLVGSIRLFNEDIEAINNYLGKAIKENKTIIICLKEYQIKRFIKELNFRYNVTDVNNIYSNKLNIINYQLIEGFTYQDLIVLTTKEIYKTKEVAKKYKTKYKYTNKISDVNKLEKGDFVVHFLNGIGIYGGLTKITTGNITKDYIEVLYKDNDKLYIPVEKIDSLSKYSAKEGVVPQISKLGSSTWKKTKAKVAEKVAIMAQKLLKLYSLREMQKGFAYSKDIEMQKEFEEARGFTLTKDQIIAVEQIKKDMESIKPMDRLLCGDVGFGKTEVAFTACFKAILDSKQVLFLCPTTILSSQHYENAKKRFAGFPVNIALLNRFTSFKDQTRIIEGIKNGTIDLVFGTHRLLGKDVMPKDLGFLIIDEEQRFGVTHKERIKEFKTNVDVLTLTATPIPRTLQMSLAGLRSLSLIETPPVDRYPVATYVINYNDQIIKDAIYKEMSRNGQAFILYNSVEKIANKLLQIQNIVPDAKIVYIHGRMNKNELANKVMAFINHEYDILLCTTIIEIGIDIPNVNTLIIIDADKFGLSQLYQIRGRVGRSNKIAYAYLMYNANKVLTETAQKRLKVIKEFTELGSGFSIATRDLSIRGAGDILGSQQSGFIDSIGMDLYMKMLNNEIKRQKGLYIEEEQEMLEAPLINVTTHISDSYVKEDNLKILIHQKINEINSYTKLLATKREIEDRFGKLNEDMNVYMYEEWFEKQATTLKIKQVKETKNSIELYFTEEMTNKLDTEEIFMSAFHITTMFRFKSIGNKLVIILDTIKLEKHPIYYLTNLLENIINMID